MHTNDHDPFVKMIIDSINIELFHIISETHICPLFMLYIGLTSHNSVILYSQNMLTIMNCYIHVNVHFGQRK
jgi:hypothetical protein